VTCQAPNTPHHRVQPPRWVLPGTQHPIPPYNRSGGAQQHPSPHTTGYNSCYPGSCQAPNSPSSPHNRHGSCQAPIIPHHPTPWGTTTTLGPVRHPSPHTMGYNNHPRSCQAPITPCHGGNSPPTAHTMGCNNHQGSCQAPNTPQHPTTTKGPVRHPTAPITIQPA